MCTRVVRGDSGTRQDTHRSGALVRYMPLHLFSRLLVHGKRIVQLSTLGPLVWKALLGAAQSSTFLGMFIGACRSGRHGLLLRMMACHPYAHAHAHALLCCDTHATMLHTHVEGFLMMCALVCVCVCVCVRARVHVTAIIWGTVCACRHATITDDLGPTIGSALCGLAVFLERSDRRAELACYVAPRAVQTLWALTQSFLLVPAVPLAEHALLCSAVAVFMTYFCHVSPVAPRPRPRPRPPLRPRPGAAASSPHGPTLPSSATLPPPAPRPVAVSSCCPSSPSASPDTQRSASCSSLSTPSRLAPSSPLTSSNSNSNSNSNNISNGHSDCNSNNISNGHSDCNGKSSSHNNTSAGCNFASVGAGTPAVARWLRCPVHGPRRAHHRREDVLKPAFRALMRLFMGHESAYAAQPDGATS